MRARKRIPNNFGKNLGRLIHNGGLSQLEFAKRSSLSTTAVFQVIHGDRDPSFSTVVKIMRGLCTVCPGLTFEDMLK